MAAKLDNVDVTNAYESSELIYSKEVSLAVAGKAPETGASPQ